MKLSWSFAALFLSQLVHIVSVHGYPVIRHERSITLESRHIGETPLAELSSRYALEYSDEIATRDWKALLTTLKGHYNTYKAGKKAMASPSPQHDHHASHPHPGSEVGHQHATQHEHSIEHPHTNLYTSQHGSQHEHEHPTQHEYGGQNSYQPNMHPDHHYNPVPPHDGGSYHPHSQGWR